ncbi:hypothetical protein WAI453_000085 [Rhynchosporium graminicola]
MKAPRKEKSRQWNLRMAQKSMGSGDIRTAQRNTGVQGAVIDDRQALTPISMSFIDLSRDRHRALPSLIQSIRLIKQTTITRMVSRDRGG